MTTTKFEICTLVRLPDGTLGKVVDHHTTVISCVEYLFVDLVHPQTGLSIGSYLPSFLKVA